MPSMRMIAAAALGGGDQASAAIQSGGHRPLRHCPSCGSLIFFSISVDTTPVVDYLPTQSCSTEGRHPGDVRLAEQGAAPAGGARNHALGRLRATSRAALRPLCEVLAGRRPSRPPGGQGATTVRSGTGAEVKGGKRWTPEARPGAAAKRKFRQKCRGGAPRGAPASVIGRWSLAIQGSARPQDGPRGAAFRTSACRRSASPRFCEGHEKEGVLGALQKIRAAKRWLPAHKSAANHRLEAAQACITRR